MGYFQDKIGLLAPSWFQERWMRALLRAFAGELDNFQQRVFGGMRSANPYAAGSRTDEGILRECDEDVLAYHARDRGIRLYSSEPLLSKRKRLGAWRQLKKRRGSHQGELRNLQPFWAAEETSILPTMRIVHQSNEGTPTATWHTLSPSGLYTVHRSNPSNWDWDGAPVKRSRFWLIIFLPPGYSSAVVYDGGEVYDGGAIYDGITTLAINDMVDAIKEAKAAHSRLAGVILTELQPNAVIPGYLVRPFDPNSTSITFPDGSTSLPTGQWDVAVDPVTNLPTRPEWASFVFEDSA